MNSILLTEEAAQWIDGLDDRVAKARVLTRIEQGNIVYVVLCGGTKASQRADIKRARKIAKELYEAGPPASLTATAKECIWV